MAPSRIDPRPLVRKALIARFNATPASAFFTAIEGRFAYAKAPQDWPLPYATFFFVDAAPIDTFTERTDDVLIQVSVWATTAGAAEDTASLAYELFEHQEMSTTGIATFKLYRDTPVPTMDEGDGNTSLWQSGITLAGLIETI